MHAGAWVLPLGQAGEARLRAAGCCLGQRLPLGGDTPQVRTTGPWAQGASWVNSHLKSFEDLFCFFLGLHLQHMEVPSPGV